MTELSQKNTAVRCRAVTKDYLAGDTVTRALRGVDLDVEAGELLMLVGPSGCGKTTLISVIAGILNQDAGECTVFGHDLHHMSDKERTVYRGRNIGFVFQAYNLIPTLTARENVAVPLLLGGMGRAQALKQAGDFLDFVGLSDKVESLPTQLSGGQQQRVAVARSLVHQPKLIVCDEPTSALDQDTGHKIMGLFRSVARANDRALIVVTHDSRIFSFADRIARMNDGQIESVSNGERTES
jgi:putative ABC transport system ATP-binding protein